MDAVICVDFMKIIFGIETSISWGDEYKAAEK